MRRVKRDAKTAPGWWWRFPLMMAVIYGFFALSSAPVGYVLWHVSDWIGAVR